MAFVSGGRAAAVLAMLLGATSPAVAGPPAGDAEKPVGRTASLAWTRSPGAESCIGPVALSKAIEQKLGREALTAPPRANLAIEGHIERIPPDGPWRVTVALVTEAGEAQGLRELHGVDKDCRALDESIALVIALLIEPGALSAPPVPKVPVAPAPPPLPPPASPAPAPIPAPERQPWRVGTEVGAMGGLGLLPGGVAGGVALTAQFTPPNWPTLQLGTAFWPPRLGATSNAGANFSLSSGSLSICPLALNRDGSALAVCVGGALGILAADTTGLAPPSRVERAVFYPHISLQYHRQLFGPMAASVAADLLVPTERARFYYVDTRGGRQDVFQQEAIAGTLGFSLGVHVP